jgi:hypothetical protein
VNHEIRDDRKLAREPLTPLKWVLYLLLLWLFCIIQASFLSYVPIFGATVELTLALVLLLGWKKGPVAGAVFGMIGGFLLDALVGVGISVLPLLFLLCGIYAAFTARQLFDHPLTYLLMTVPAYADVGAWRAICEKSFVHLFAVVLAGIIGSLIVYIPAAVRCFRRKY